MKLTEKMSYLRGLMDGLEIDEKTKEGKALVQMSEVMSELVLYVEDLQAQVDELTELCDILDQDLGQVEDDFYEDENFSCGGCGECLGADDEDDDEDFEELDEDDEYGYGVDEADYAEFDDDEDDDELYEVTCPTCGDTILIDEGMIEEGAINCPNCNELLEFDYDELTIEDFESVDQNDDSDDEE